MKRLIAILLCLIMTSAVVACHKKEAEVVVPEKYATITFVVDGELYTATAPQPIEVKVGQAATLPFPEGAAPIDEHNELCWYVDDAYTAPYDTTQPLVGDLTLYLYERGRTYTIRYQGLEGFDVVGEYVYSYRYNGETADLPSVRDVGYQDGLYCVELDAQCVKVPTQAGQDLTFTAPKARSYGITYRSKDVPMSEVVNPNPDQYDKIGQTLYLAPAHSEGHTFDCWAIRLTSRPKSFVVGDTEVELYEGKRVEWLSFEMIMWAGFVLEAQWN